METAIQLHQVAKVLPPLSALPVCLPSPFAVPQSLRQHPASQRLLAHFLPILFGGGFEYFIDSKLALNFNLHMGPAIDTPTGLAYFDLDALFGLAMRF